MQETGTIYHNGNSYTAGGASVNGRHITAYLQNGNLQTWHGQIILSCRSETVETYWNEWGDAEAIVFGLTQGRFVVGYALGNGMLFRGELVTDCDSDEARIYAEQLAERFSEIDAEDEARLEADFPE